MKRGLVSIINHKWWWISGIIVMGVVLLLKTDQESRQNPEPQITKFSLSPTTIHEGEAMTATWETTHGTQAFMNGQAVPLVGTVTMVPLVSSTYTLSLKNEHGQQVEWQQIVEVVPRSSQPPPSQRQEKSNPPVVNTATKRRAQIDPPVSDMAIISATPRLDLSLDGTWNGTDGSVWYLRQIDEALWGVSFSADKGQSHTAVVKATQLGEIMQASLVGVPHGKDLAIRNETMLVDLQKQEMIRVGSGEEKHQFRLSWTTVNDPLNLEAAEPPSSSAYQPTVRNLTGIWWANDGGMYYIQQREKTIWGLGVGPKGERTFTNVFQGTQSGDVIEGEWIDLPKGERYEHGVLQLRIIDSGAVLQLQPENSEGKFSGMVLEPIPTSEE